MSNRYASLLAQPNAASPEAGRSSGQHFLHATLSWLRGVPVMPCIATFLALAGVVCVAPTALYLWTLWKIDPLKSIGGLVPLASLALVLRAWRTLRWEAQGSWWGLWLLLLTIALVRLRESAVMELILTRSWTLALPPPSLLAVGYAAGCVLLFGGPRLLRAARFPVVLMALVNPVPHVFVRRLDLPLQYASAHLARAFAHRAGVKLTSDQLRLMFTPDFGMFIAPGCNGLRGAIAMGLLALIAGHVYRLRLRSWMALVLGAISLGYLFNFLRLFELVLYYLAALHFPSLQDRAEMADYCIGATLFFCAALLLFAVVQRWRSSGAAFAPAEDPAIGPAAAHSQLTSQFALRYLLFAGMIGWTVASYPAGLRPTAAQVSYRPYAPNAYFPASAGSFLLRRQWDESLDTGVLLYHWAEYAQAPGSPVITVGVSPTLGAHDSLLCHVARGEEWLWHGDLQLPSASGQTSFSTSQFNDGVTQSLEAATLCSRGQCGEHTLGEAAFQRHRLGFVYSRITPGSLLQEGVSRPVPVLLRAETTDMSISTDQARAQLTAQLRSFVLQMDPILLGRSPR